MKKQINKLKLAALSMGFLFLFSCTGDVTGGSAFQNTSVLNESLEKVGENPGAEVGSIRAGEILQGSVIPFFFGTVDATLR